MTDTKQTTQQGLNNAPGAADNDADDDELKLRTFRATDDLWERAKAKARKTRIPMSVVIRQLLEKWVEED